MILRVGLLRSLRCSPEAAVFVGSDKRSCWKISSVLEAFRRLLLQIGGANIAGVDRAVSGQLRRWVGGRGSHESVKISLISSDAQFSRSVSFSGCPESAELVGRGTSTEPAASLTTLRG